MTNVVAAILLLISGVYYPIETLPRWLQRIAAASPATYVIQGMRACLLAGESTVALLPTVFLLIGVGVAIIAIGLVDDEAYRSHAAARGRTLRIVDAFCSLVSYQPFPLL